MKVVQDWRGNKFVVVGDYFLLIEHKGIPCRSEWVEGSVSVIKDETVLWESNPERRFAELVDHHSMLIVTQDFNEFPLEASKGDIVFKINDCWHLRNINRSISPKLRPDMMCRPIEGEE